MRQSLYAVLGLSLVGCGSEPPAFIEKPVFGVNFTVEGEGLEEEVTQDPLPPDTDLDAILADLGVSSDDAVPNDGGPGHDTPSPRPEEGGGGGNNPQPSRGGTLEPGQSDEWVTPDFSRPSQGEMKACARIAGVSESRLKIAGNKKDAVMGAADVLVARITGNQNRLALTFRGEAGSRLAGICLFLAGNQAEVELKTNLTIARVLYTARGNQSSGNLVAEQGGDFEDMVVDLSGNGASLSVRGVTSCPDPRIKGSGTSFQCAPR